MRNTKVVRLSLFSMGSVVFALQLAHADVITDWNERAVAAGYAARITPSESARNIAMVHLAMFEALNSIEPRYAPYRARLATESTASREAAGASAAHYLLVRLYPDQAKEMEKTLATSLAAVSDGPAKTEGLRLGEQAARAMLDDRRGDGTDAANTYRPFTVAGKYVPTTFPATPGWGVVRPFALKGADQFIPGAPYALTSKQWAKDYAEVKKMGAKSGSARSKPRSRAFGNWSARQPITPWRVSCQQQRTWTFWIMPASSRSFPWLPQMRQWQSSTLNINLISGGR